MVELGLSYSSMLEISPLLHAPQPLLAQVNVGNNYAVILGIALAVSGAMLYGLRSWKPELTRDHDIFFAAIALLCGGILFFQGWRLDPILFFGQLLLTGSAAFFAVESIRLRGIATEQARRNATIADEERPVSRVYRAELDELDAYEERPVTRRIRGSRDAEGEDNEYGEEPRRRTSNRRNNSRSSERSAAPTSRSRRRSRSSADDYDYRTERRRSSAYQDDESGLDDDDRSASPTRDPREANEPTRPRRRSSSARGRSARSSAWSRQDGDVSSADYVDYQPLNSNDGDYPSDEDDY